jgi:hypothetical protein
MWEKEILTALWMLNNRDTRPVNEEFLDVRFLQ